MNIREELYSKMEKEYDLFIENLKQLSPEKNVKSHLKNFIKDGWILMEEYTSL